MISPISRNVLSVLIFLASGGLVIQAGAQDCLKTGCPPGERALHRINQSSGGVAIQGCDPVAYHAESRGVKGSSDFEHA